MSPTKKTDGDTLQATVGEQSAATLKDLNSLPFYIFSYFTIVMLLALFKILMH